ncbi:hypothetical protein [Novosphingobium sp.]|uniref:hypothetical protein n=1 Tax=Novosphingobium sp. TaxID=1874826 RepID=UPI00333E4523
MWTRSAFYLALSVLFSLAETSYPARAQSPSCTDQWLAQRRSLPLAQRYETKRADAFGKQCLGITAKKPINWPAVRQDLDQLIKSEDPLNSTIPNDIAAFCPPYGTASPAKRAVFWRELLYQVIKPEAGNNANAFMWEQPVDHKGHPLDQGEYSIGLLQLSVSNRHPYGCDIPDEKSLLDPHLNLACGVKIASYLVGHAGMIGGDAAHGRRGLGAYWATIRVPSAKPARDHGSETRAPIIKAVRQLAVCKS